jgi:methyltransferase (TIGR00027 family)
MGTRRIETTTSRTAQFTCMSRAASSFEREPYFRCDDRLAAALAPWFVRALLRLGIVRMLFRRTMAREGIYTYLIARTKYIDAALRRCLEEGFEQVALLGAGFDTRALRFQRELNGAKIFELDAPVTQSAKIARYKEKGLALPPNLVFVPIDFDRESPVELLKAAGFVVGRRSLFLLEGVLMYLQPESVDEAFRAMRALGGPGSRVVFDYVLASALHCEGAAQGEADIARMVRKANELWHFGLEPGEVEPFLARRGFRMLNHRDAGGLEALYFTDDRGRRVSQVNKLHCLVTAELEKV